MEMLAVFDCILHALYNIDGARFQAKCKKNKDVCKYVAVDFLMFNTISFHLMETE